MVALLRPGPSVLVALLFAGYVKSSPALSWFPVDLTLAAAAGVALLCADMAVGNLRAGRPMYGSTWVLLLFGTFVLATGNAGDTTYATDKVVRLFTVTAAAALGGVLLVDTRRRRELLAWSFVGAGLALVVLYWVAPTTDANLYGRAALAGSNTLALGRGIACSLVALVALAVGGRVRWWTSVPLAGAMASVVFATGSRGPLLGAGIAVLVMAAAHPWKRARNLVCVAVGCVAAAWWGLANTNSLAGSRILQLFTADKGESVSEREWLYARSLAQVDDAPWGLGWGNAERILLPIAPYPHNLVLETAVEAGWLGGAALLSVLGVATARAVRGCSDWTAVAVLGLLVFWMVNAFVSGDLNDNRAVFALLGVALAIRPPARPSAGATLTRPKRVGHTTARPAGV